MSYSDLAGKVIVITGAGGNLGRAVTRYFDAANAELALVDITRDQLEKRYDEPLKSDWFPLEANLTEEGSAEAMAQAVREHFGEVYALINIAGGYSGGKNTLKTDFETWQKMLNLNATSVFLASRAIARILVEQGTGGRIINIGAKPGLHGTKNHAAYAASKSAVLRITESMAAEFRDQHITVNAVLPSIIDTVPNRKSMPNADFSDWVSPESLADVIGFLTSEAARDISGALIPVYGRVG